MNTNISSSHDLSNADLPHVPVMLEPTLMALEIATENTAHENIWYVDGTFGAGGHTKAFLARGVNVLALDRDTQAQDYAKDLATSYDASRFRFALANFASLAEVCKEQNIVPQGILLDLGVSSMQLDIAERGFAFRHDGPLDMRMGLNALSAETVVNTYDQAALAAIIYKYGEDRHSRRIASAIVQARADAPIVTTRQLADVVASAYPGGIAGQHRRREHPARRTFQALRMVVNGELDALETALEAASSALAAGGRLVVLSYHSLEDRIVKHFLRNSQELTPLEKKPLTATPEEIADNPRARSAKLRSAQKSSAQKYS